MSNYKHPGVYLEEIPTLPPSVAEVSTAVPAFIGYTQKAVKEGKDITNEPTKISTFLEYQTLFGGPEAVGFEVSATEIKDTNDVVTETKVNTITRSGELKKLMYHSVDMYFRNGGGPCYIVSVGNGAPKTSDIIAGLNALEAKDEPTLIVIPDAVSLVDSNAVSNAANESAVTTATADYFTVCQAILAQCAKMKDRFAILDVLNLGSAHVSDEANFRNNIGANNLKYGAAYYPYLNTSLNYHYQEDQVNITGLSSAQVKQFTQTNAIKVTYNGTAATPKVKILLGSAATDPLGFEVDTQDPNAPVLGILNVKVDASTSNTGAEILAGWQTWIASNSPQGYTIAVEGDGSAQVTNISTAVALDTINLPSTLSSIKQSDTGLYNDIKNQLNSQRITLPPGAVIAGVYATTDREVGVWKAPANVGVSAVMKPAIKVNNEKQDTLNIDENSGKSINVVRNFIGQGTLVWGARTLAGNDNEWRYVPVRRLFNMLEESIKNATEFAVFEPNNGSTWQRVRTTIDSYLYDLWQRGALAGSTAETAYFVNVGLGKTMNPQDILEGRMIIEVGVAAVRPAEFIVLRFSHKLQEV